MIKDIVTTALATIEQSVYDYDGTLNEAPIKAIIISIIFILALAANIAFWL